MVDKNEMRDMGKAALSLSTVGSGIAAGTKVGVTAGTAIGSVAGPPGMFVGGLGGALIGGLGGGAAAAWLVGDNDEK